MKTVFIFIGRKIVEIAGAAVGIVVITLLGYGMEMLHIGNFEYMDTPALHFVMGLGCVFATVLSIMITWWVIVPWIKWNWEKAKKLSNRKEKVS